jgi:hypothetical protein
MLQSVGTLKIAKEHKMFSTSASQVSSEANYIESVFSTYLYTGNSSTQTIANGIDLAGKGGMVWMKSRNFTYSNNIFDTVRNNGYLETNTDRSLNAAGGGAPPSSGIYPFNSNGFTLIDGLGYWNRSSYNYVSWTFRKQAKFFDVVTYTGTGSATTIAHNLGSVPGCIIVKRTDNVGNWQVYHNSLTSAANSIQLNLTNAQVSAPTVWNSTAPTSTVFSVGTDATVNASGGTYVAYIFAHNAGGFGLTGNDNVISCGSFTTDSGGNATVNLGYEPQWLMFKGTTSPLDWYVEDSMRGWVTTLGSSSTVELSPDSNAAETGSGFSSPTSTGFKFSWVANTTFIYIAIRRGPMKVPTSGTSVYYNIARTGTGATATISNMTFPPDLIIGSTRTVANGSAFSDFLRGPNLLLFPYGTYSEYNASDAVLSRTNVGFTMGADTGTGNFNTSGTSVVQNCFRRAPGFFDEVCYTGTGVARTVTHNLGVAPELMIVKDRTTSWNWIVSGSLIGASNFLILNGPNNQASNSQYFNNTNPTSSVFTVGTQITTNGSGDNYVAYLFATCPGVSKVGSYTGTGATQTIDCGFTGGARFVLIKRTDTTGDWYVWDTARGMVSGTDPSLLLNSTAAEVNANSVYTTGVGFQIVSTAAGINASGGSYIFLAIA